MHKIWSLLS